MTESASKAEQRLSSLATLLRDAFEPPTAPELERGLQALRRRLATERARPRLALRRVLLAASVMGCFLLGAATVRLASPSLVTATPVVAVTRITGGEILAGGYLSEVGGAGVQLSFSEGSSIVLTPGTRGRLRSLAPEGARFELGRGTGTFAIEPSAERRWLVEAGPFSVAVKGTDFTVVWDPATELLEVELRRGRVTVSGPVIGNELTLRPGQTLSVSLPRAETRVVEASAEPASRPELAVAEAGAPPTSGSGPRALPVLEPPRAVASSPSPPRASSDALGDRRGWRAAMASGKWDLILDDVERVGVTTSLRTAASDELFVIADAARYRRRSELSRAALLAQLERFPSSPRSLDAVFLLGRVEELRADGKARAIARYDEYLSRAPRGTYAAPALGRKMILLKETQGPESARESADEYLERFPNGSYAEAARSLRRPH